MAAALTFDALVKQIRSGQYAPVYILHGEEGYYIDELVKEFEKIIPEEEREFNMLTLYAPETEPGAVIDVCMSVPMMADHQLVIVKEAQEARADKINKLYKYVQNPQPQTILVICFRGEKAKGKDLLAAAKKNGVMFESAKIPDYRIAPVISDYITKKGMSTSPKALEMLRDYIGADMSRLTNEIDKLADILGAGAAVTPEAIERYIGISKDFNAFELVDALAARRADKVYRIADYFASNPKANPVQPVTASIFSLFADLLVAYYTPDRSDQGLMQGLGLKSAFPLKRIRMAMQNYNAFQIIEIIDAIRRFDGQSKGVGSRQDSYALFRELMHHILTAPGKLPV